MTLTTISLQTLADAIGGPVGATGWIHATATTARQSGGVFTLPDPVRARIVDGAVAGAPFVLERPDGWAWRFTFYSDALDAPIDGGLRIWADVAAVSFASTVVVSANTLTPLVEQASALALFEQTALRVDGVEAELVGRLSNASLDSMAKSSAEKMTTAETFAVLTSRLAMGHEDAVLTILGDSTGNETTEWVYLVTQWLATRYPKYTVTYRLYNDVSKTYDAVVTIQTGSVPRTLSVYNGSVSGTDAAYSVTNFATQVPVAPTLFIINFSHNGGGSTDYRPVMYALTRLINDEHPQAGIVLTAQNPQGRASRLGRRDSRECSRSLIWPLRRATGWSTSRRRS